MADPAPIVVSGGGGSRFGETLLILAALALAAWFIFKRKPGELVVSPEPAPAAPPPVPTTTGAGSARPRGALIPGRDYQCPPGTIPGIGGCIQGTPPPRDGAALFYEHWSGTDVLASTPPQKPAPVTVPQGATASPPAQTSPTAGAYLKPTTLVKPEPSFFTSKPAPIFVASAPALKPTPLIAPAPAPPPSAPPPVFVSAAQPRAGLFVGSNLLTTGGGAFTKPGVFQ